MRTAGGLTPELTGPADLSLVGPDGRTDLTYSGLKVVDAAGRRLPAHLEASGGTVRIAFDDRGAQYPVAIDPWIQVADLNSPSDANTFGTVVATSANGSTVLVGDPYGGTGGVGEATVYTSSGDSWSAGIPLVPPAAAESFGTSVALSANGTTAIVGDPDDGASGAATVYTYNGTSWSSGTPLIPPATALYFGTSVALSTDGTVALVGDPSGGVGFGAATVYEGPGFDTTLSLAPPDTARAFGTSVALGGTSGATALVGDSIGGPSSRGVANAFTGSHWGTRTQLVEPANSKNFATSVALSASGSTALVGDPTGNGGTGGAYIETFNGSTWSTPTPLARPSGAGAFGSSVALGGTTALVGDPTGGGGTGAATTYSGSGSTWSAGSPLTPPQGATAFGTSVAVSQDGSTALVGDPEGGPTQVGTMTAYISNGSSWNLGTAVVSPANAYSFGSSVALSENGSTLLGGDPGDGSTPGGEVTVYKDNDGTLSSGAQLDRPLTSNSFGTSVAVSGNGTTAIVGDPYGGESGEATIYTFNGTTWSSGTPLPPPDTANSFGTSVALSADGKTALVGDPLGGDSETGAATVFSLSNGSWTAGQSLNAPDDAQAFGTSVALSPDGATALVGDPAANGGGTVTAYSDNSGSWSAGTQLPVPTGSRQFGTSVALSFSGVAAIVGDPEGGGSQTGAADVFSFNGLSWSTGTALTAPPGSVSFGTSVGISDSGTRAIVGDPGTNQAGTTTLYNFAGNAWSSGMPLQTPVNAGLFGTSVAFSGAGTTAAVGDPDGNANSDGQVTVFTFQSTLAQAVVTASATPATASLGDPVTYSATVAPQSGAGTPTGAVSFTDGPLTLCTATLVSGSGSCQATNTPIGNGDVFASYSGDSTYAASSGNVPVDVVRVPSATAVTVSPASSTVGSSVTFSADVTSAGGTPTGSVTFSVGGTTLCTTGPLSAGAASCTATDAPAGADTVTGTYSGDSTFTGSAGTAQLAVTYPSATGIGLSASTTSTGYGSAGQTIPFSYLVTNTGTTTLTGVSVTDVLVPSVSCPSTTLTAGNSETCSGSYTVTQADVDAGSVASSATASGYSEGTEVVSDPWSVTVTATLATSAIGLTGSSTSTGYGSAGQTVPFSYLVTDTGTTTLTGVSLSDPVVPSVSCPSTTLAPGASETCTGSYTVTTGAVEAGSLTSTATASGTDPHGVVVNSTPSSVTVPAADCAPPIFTSSGSETATAGSPVDFEVTTCSTAPPVFKASGLPKGLRLVDANGGASLSGTPASSDRGIYSATISASVKGQAVATQNLVITVDHAPVLKPAVAYLAKVGTAVGISVTAAEGYPIPTLATSSALPSGVSFEDQHTGAGELTGIPGATAGGVYPITVTAANGVGPPVEQLVTLTVYQLPVITSPATDAIAPVGAMTPFTVDATGYPAVKLTASGLPSGLKLLDTSAGTGVISGTARATAGATYHVTITASNKAGSSTQAFTLTAGP
ncbi:MAG: beta strand repeat-containing protein [Acidimicrobiales bacterium]